MLTTTTRAPIEVRAGARPAASPRLFITTAMPKSGSNWLEAMIFSLPGVGGFGGRRGSCGYLTLSALTRVPEAIAFVNRAGLRVGDVLARLLEPGLSLGEPMGAEHRAEAERVLARVRLRIPVRTGLLRPEEERLPDLSRLVEPLCRLPGQGDSPAGLRAVGCPAKHEPAASLAAMLPGWRIVQLIRDPRDVLVSRFYHDLAHMDPVMCGMFVKGSGASVTMRGDWMEAYFGKRRDDVLAYYARFEDELLREDVRLVTRYEDLLLDTGQELARVAGFIGLDAGALEPDLQGVCDRFAFDRVASGDGAQVDSASRERRNSFLRKGKAGDWQAYFDRRLTAVLGASFNELLVRLGYERDDRWVQRVATEPARAWDFGRLRVRQSLARSFRSIWDADPALQARYPDPADVLTPGGSFVDAIIAAGDPTVRSHHATLLAMAGLWRADVAETVAF